MNANTPMSSKDTLEVKRSFSEISNCNASSPEVQTVIEEAHSLVDKLKSNRLYNLGESSGEESRPDDTITWSKQELVHTLDSLSRMLLQSNEQVNRLKLKNMMLTTGLRDSNSRFEVESSLNKQQFERIRCQLVMETHGLHEKVRIQDLKLAKYKETIIEKNKEINKMARLLNDSPTPNSVNLRNTPQSITKAPRLNRNSKLQRRNSNMLATLGLLASHVLSVGNESQVNADNTESDISHDSFSHHQSSAKGSATSPHVLNIPTLPSITSASLTPTSEDSASSKQSFQMPKLRSFSTCDGAVNDLP
ncbi:LANO_0G17788g1_1 [Lachancea nothofagi CBS 11611]|uniref:LANO_0G17788g1_1 n=1 Tax=Lachancea nothofagi CBS 11611 TaxID=1266666 RepID=A0A1G4KKH6_9SACH|nr:LANO_0G17788g1_1 [Lachancea nothofagi CBS 11611]